MYKLVRGDLAYFNNTHMEIMQQLLSESKFGEVQELITSARLSQNYSDTMYSISFRTNRSILIKALSFWGPFRQNRENYNVKVMFTQYKNKFLATDEFVVDKFETVADAENSKKCLLQFPRAVRLEKGKWIRISFQLNGADTCVCSSVSNYYYLKECDIEFDFLDSSHQIPEIHFELTE